MNPVTLIGLLLVVASTVMVSVAGFPNDPITPANEKSRVEELFQNFIREFGKQYGNVVEQSHRRSVFETNLHYIEEHNRQFAQGKYSYMLAVNTFADLTHEEFLARYMRRVNIHPFLNTSGVEAQNGETVGRQRRQSETPPVSVDWRTKGYVTPVKDQLACSACWAFSVTGAIEGQHAKRTGELVSLSEQQLVDCSISFGNGGCYGGDFSETYTYIINAGGLASAQDYPYTAKDGQCQYQANLARVQVLGYTFVSRGETSLKAAVGLVGPVSVGIDASRFSFQFYSSGIYNEPFCSSSYLNHAVLVVGYGTSTSDYWIVKNSWGTSWGNQGYILMTRNAGNQCGIASEANYPTTS